MVLLGMGVSALTGDVRYSFLFTSWLLDALDGGLEVFNIYHHTDDNNSLAFNHTSN